MQKWEQRKKREEEWIQLCLAWLGLLHQIGARGSSLSLGREGSAAIHHVSLLQLSNCTQSVTFYYVAGLSKSEFGRAACVSDCYLLQFSHMIK